MYLLCVWCLYIAINCVFDGEETDVCVYCLCASGEFLLQQVFYYEEGGKTYVQI